MAGGKQSPRQKMISLMYLVLLAMLAMQVSVDVMDAFAKMYNRTESSIEKGLEKNKKVLAELERLSKENPAQYATVFSDAKKIEGLTKDFVTEIQVIKAHIEKTATKKEDGELDAQAMGKPDALDEFLFREDKLTPAGQKFVDAVDKYREAMLKIAGGMPSIAEQLNGFSTEKQKGHDGVMKNWLDYTFKGVPTIGSIAILSSMENEVLNIENEALTASLSGRLMKATSANNLQAIIKTNKAAYFAGDKVETEIFLGSKDASKVPNSIVVNGRSINLNDSKSFKDGVVKVVLPAGKVGDNKILGKFTFIEKGKSIEIPIESNYVVVQRSNQAIVSAEKMNVVYRGLDNPINISMAGIAANKLSASAPGLRQVSGTSFMLRPGGGSEVSISVTGTTDSGDKISSAPVKFRIKDIPSPMASIRGEYGSLKMPKASLSKSTISAGLPDFVFDLSLRVKSFQVKVPGRTTITVAGDRMDGAAQAAIAAAKPGDMVTIFGVKSEIIGNSSYNMRPVAPLTVEISN